MRKGKILILFLSFLSVESNAKFSISVFNIPCEKITLKVKNCENVTFTNQNSKYGRIPKEQITYKGVLATGDVLQTEIVKCHPKQKMEVENFKPGLYNKDDKFFIEKGMCPGLGKTLSARSVKAFCDTPGATSINSCFIEILKHEEKLHFFEVLK